MSTYNINIIKDKMRRRKVVMMKMMMKKMMIKKMMKRTVLIPYNLKF
jgi:hypothetical protein